MKTRLFAVLLALVLAGPVAADRADDDLAAVKKAVGRPAAQAEARGGSVRSAARAPAEDETGAASQRSRSRDPKWLRVRVIEKEGKRARVSVNLPLALVRALGENWPLHGCGRCGDGRGLTLGEVLRALDSGQSLVEVDDVETTVRVWVD